ncbi:MAG: PRC-barrel domain-containing protein [Nitrospinae bacterium]|nr:PRC-barrel domain-containing protein [Nitrospinota bacterium]
MIRAFKTEVNLPFEWRIRRFDVIDSTGKTVAPVLDLLYDPEAREVRYVMVEIGGLLRIAGKRLLIPASLFIRAGSGQVQALLPQEILIGSPMPEDAEQPTRGEEEAIFSYFETAPYWEPRGLIKKIKKEGEPESPPVKPTDINIGELKMESDDKGAA